MTPVARPLIARNLEQIAHHPAVLEHTNRFLASFESGRHSGAGGGGVWGEVVGDPGADQRHMRGVDHCRRAPWMIQEIGRGADVPEPHPVTDEEDDISRCRIVVLIVAVGFAG